MRGPRKVALGFGNSRLCRERIDVARCNIEDLIKLSQCFWETTKVDVGSRMLVDQINIAGVEPLRFVELQLASIPFTASPRNIGKRFRNLAAIRQELACLAKITYRGVVILQTSIVVISGRMQRFAEIRLKGKRGFGSLPCFFTDRDSWLKNVNVGDRIDV